MTSGLIIGAGLLDQLVSRSSISEAISLATTACQRSMNFLMEKRLV
jgi:hypothetical protein